MKHLWSRGFEKEFSTTYLDHTAASMMKGLIGPNAGFRATSKDCAWAGCVEMESEAVAENIYVQFKCQIMEYAAHTLRIDRDKGPSERRRHIISGVWKEIEKALKVGNIDGQLKVWGGKMFVTRGDSCVVLARVSAPWQEFSIEVDAEGRSGVG